MAEPGDPGDPVYKLPVNIGDKLVDSDLIDSAGSLLRGITDTLTERLTDRVFIGVNYGFSPAERLYNTELPADPFYDADGDPSTEELRGTGGRAGFLMQVAQELYIKEGGGTAAGWNALSFAEQCEWIQSYEAPEN
jgi:hypothetical protein